MGESRPVRVVQSCWESEGVMSLTLRTADAQPLPSWDPGAHIDLVLPSGNVRQYSLCGEPDRSEYRVAVLREEFGRGGSVELHDTALVGRTLRMLGPRNRFELEPASSYVFVAGGIGITPILAMIRKVAERGCQWELHYGGRRTETMAFIEELTAVAERSAGQVHLRSDGVEGPLPLADIVGSAPDDALLYACGPDALLTALADSVGYERPTLSLRYERFTKGAAEFALGADDALTDASEQDSFDVELAQTGQTVQVKPGQSILDAIREKRPDTLYSCEEGFCGTCETKILDGTPIHRDSILTKKERAKNATMMICVGGCASDRLVLDL